MATMEGHEEYAYMLVTESGRSRGVKANTVEGVGADNICGLDEDGRIVVDNFGTREKPYESGQFLFGLTLCHDASDKGVESGIVCRACYGDASNGADVGNYLWRDPDGSFPGLDPIKSLIG